VQNATNGQMRSLVSKAQFFAFNDGMGNADFEESVDVGPTRQAPQTGTTLERGEDRLNPASSGRWIRGSSSHTIILRMPRNQLIVQLPITASTSLDALLHVEQTLIQAFSQNSFAEVDGHDIGQGRFNIFIYPTGTWRPVLERVYAFLKLRGVLKDALVVKRLKTSEKYVVVWPEQFKGTFEL